MSIATEALLAAAARSTSSTPVRKGELVHLPLDFADGDVVSVYVEQIDGDRYLVSDLGEAAALLARSDVDLDREVVARAWRAIRSASAAPALLAPETGEFAIATTADRSGLGEAILQVGAGMVRAECLQALAPRYRPKTFAANLVRRAADHDLTVVPEADMPAQFGGTRRVTCEIRAGVRDVFAQALSRAGDRGRAYDHVRSLFSDASPDLALDRRVIVVQEGMTLLRWQTDALRQGATLVAEAGLDDYLVSLAA